MARYCTNCGAKLDGNPRFCGNCGKPCAATDNSRPVQNSPAPNRPLQNRGPVNQGSSGGIGKFLAGTAVGAFFMHLFGNSSSASASSAPHTEPAEHYHETVVYRNDDYDNNNYNNDYDYGSYDDNSSYNDDWDTGGSDFDSDSYDDYGGFDDSYDD